MTCFGATLDVVEVLNNGLSFDVNHVDDRTFTYLCNAVMQYVAVWYEDAKVPYSNVVTFEELFERIYVGPLSADNMTDRLLFWSYIQTTNHYANGGN